MNNLTCLVGGFAFAILGLIGLEQGTALIASLAYVGISTAITAASILVIMPALVLFGTVCTFKYYLNTCDH